MSLKVYKRCQTHATHHLHMLNLGVTLVGKLANCGSISMSTRKGLEHTLEPAHLLQPHPLQFRMPISIEPKTLYVLVETKHVDVGIQRNHHGVGLQNLLHFGVDG